MELQSKLFRDVEPSKLDLEKNKRFIMERILMKGSLKDVFALLKYYGLEAIKTEITQSRYIDKRTLSFCSVLFHVKKEDFRCSKLKQSMTPHWNY